MVGRAARDGAATVSFCVFDVMRCECAALLTAARGVLTAAAAPAYLQPPPVY